MRVVAAGDEFLRAARKPFLIAGPIDKRPAVDDGLDSITANLADDCRIESGAEQDRLLIDFGMLVILTVDRLQTTSIEAIEIKIHEPAHRRKRNVERQTLA